MMSYQHELIIFFTDLTGSRAIDEKCPAMSDLIHHVTTYVNHRNTINFQETIPQFAQLTFRCDISHIFLAENDDNDEVPMVETVCQWSPMREWLRRM